MSISRCDLSGACDIETEAADRCLLVETDVRDTAENANPEGRRMDARRKSQVESVFGVLKKQRGMRAFRSRGLAKVGAEFALAATAHNLTRMYRHH